MDQSLALNALAPYIALAKAATSPRAAADLITQATSSPNTYVFAELLQQPNIQALKGNAEYGAFYELLCVFCWGTWESYTSTPNLPPLSDTQALKLRLLSLLTIASEKSTQPTSPSSNLSYATLSARLGLSSPIDLEHLITQAIYSNLLTATLNPSTQTVIITSVSPLRDLAPGSIATMMAELDAWSLRCTSVLAELDAEMARVRAEAARRAAREGRTEKQVKAVVEGMGGGEKSGVLGSSRGGGNARVKGRKDAGGDDGEDEGMDVDEMEGGGGGGTGVIGSGRRSAGRLGNSFRGGRGR